MVGVIISIIAQLLPILLDWFVEKSKEPDRRIIDDAPAPKKMRDKIADTIIKHPGYGKSLEKRGKVITEDRKVVVKDENN
jgi:hypothetical protein